MRLLMFRRPIWLPAAALLGMLAQPARAATFDVDSLGDFSDENPGNGVCATARFGTGGLTIDCSLRGAIEEANANPGVDTIEFSVAGTIRPSSGPLPVIIEAVIIDGSTAPGAPTRDRELGLNPVSLAPTLFIDGANLGGAPIGLQLNNGARGSEIYNLGITSFGGSGLRLAFGAGPEETIVSGNWIGQAADRSAAANGSGIDVSSSGTVNVRIGHDGTSLAGTGRGNVISGNLGVGLIGLVSGVIARGNWIGSAGDGALVPELGGSVPMEVANGGSGISLTGAGNAVIDNDIAGNGDPQVLLRGAGSVATSNAIFGVILDPAVFQNPESVVPGSSDGLRVLGPGAEVRNNDVWANEIGILLDSMSGVGVDVGGEVSENTVVLNAVDGILLSGVSGVTLDENSAFLNGGYGMRIETDDNLIRGNTIGMAISATEGFGNDQGGLLIGGDDNVLAETPVVGISAPEPNSIAFNGGPGITVLGDGATLEDNAVALNDGIGILINSAQSTTVTGNTLFGNVIAPGGDGNGIVVSGSAGGSLIASNFFSVNKGAAVLLESMAGEQHQIISNLYLRNAGISIDLNGDGETANDPNDPDSGVNRLQNYPELSNLSFDPGTSPPSVTVNYRVRTTGANSTLPLTIEFYYADGAFERGGLSLHDPTLMGLTPNPFVGYNNPPAIQTVTLNLTDGAIGGALRAIAIDADGNTSEFSPAIEFGEIDDSLFNDGFEGGACRVICPITDPECVMCRR